MDVVNNQYQELQHKYEYITLIEELEDAFKKDGESYYCMIVEPLLQGAGGMRMYDIEFLKRARQLCDEYDVILIFDDVATGFGRTGN